MQDPSKCKESKHKECIDSIIDAIAQPFGKAASDIDKTFGGKDKSKNDFFDSLGDFLSSIFCCNQPKNKEGSPPQSPFTFSPPINHRRSKLGATPPSKKQDGTSSQNPASLTSTYSPIETSTRNKVPRVLKVIPVIHSSRYLQEIQALTTFSTPDPETKTPETSPRSPSSGRRGNEL